jgi:hypothetical protein
MHLLITRYIALIEQWQCAMDTQDSDKANLVNVRIDACLAAIRVNEVEGEIIDLVTHESDAVKLFAGAALRTIRPEDAKQFYQGLARSKLPYIAVSAKYIAKEL